MRKNRKFVWRLYPSFLIVVLISLAAVTGYTTRSVREFYLDQTRKDLITQGVLLEKQLSPLLAPLDATAIEKFCPESVQDTETRLTVILPNGVVIGDSAESPKSMDNHRNRPEVQQALKGEAGSSIRYSATVNRNMMYVAMPVYLEGSLKAALRVSVAVTSIDEKVNAIQLDIAIAGILTAILASVICWWLARRVSLPMEQMKQGAEKFAEGDLKYRLAMPNTLEMASLAEAMNEMAEQLESWLAAIINQRNEYEAVLTSMVEGVIAVDLEENLLSVNQAAARMLDIPAADLKKISIQEIIRNPKLHRFVSQTLRTGKQSEGDITIDAEPQQTLNLVCSPLHNAKQEQIGALLALQDVTRLRNLEIVRQDFVANVSHELKTPLTAIKGFVETLLDHSAPQEPEEVNRFLNIINKHVDRLSAIIEDLMSLANIERLDKHKENQFKSQKIQPVVESALQILQSKANQKQITFDVKCDEPQTAFFDAGLIEQALVNLLDNAINYSPEKSEVQVTTGRLGAEFFISVKDNGPGIHQKHLPRLFERFYRADKARSRDMGGTGLGLAIVKHIVQRHSGRVDVETATGKGSDFTIYLPAEKT